MKKQGTICKAKTGKFEIIICYYVTHNIIEVIYLWIKIKNRILRKRQRITNGFPQVLPVPVTNLSAETVLAERIKIRF